MQNFFTLSKLYKQTDISRKIICNRNRCDGNMVCIEGNYDVEFLNGKQNDRHMGKEKFNRTLINYNKILIS